MNKKKKVANKKHYKTRVRLKTLRDLSLKKTKKKPAKVLVPKEEGLVDNKEQNSTKPDKESTKKKPVAKKPAKKKPAAKKPAKKKPATKK